METQSEPLKLAQALLDAQTEFSPVLKDASNPAFRRDGRESKYATLDSVLSAVRPALTKYKLLITQAAFRPPLAAVELESKEVGVRTTLLHVPSGEKYVNELTAPGGNANRFDIQTIGATITYLRRYELLTMLGLAPEDDDGNTSAGRSQSEQSPRPASSTPKATIPSFNLSSPNKPSNTSLVPLEVVFPHSSTPPDTKPIPKTTDSRPTPILSTTLADINAIPTTEQYEGYVAKAITLLETLQKTAVKHELKPPTKLAFKKYLTRVGKVEKTEELTIGKWDVIFAEFEKLLAANPKQAVELIKEGA